MNVSRLFWACLFSLLFRVITLWLVLYEVVCPEGLVHSNTDHRAVEWACDWLAVWDEIIEKEFQDGDDLRT